VSTGYLRLADCGWFLLRAEHVKCECPYFFLGRVALVLGAEPGGLPPSCSFFGAIICHACRT
jgi:hypothetical protein